MTFKHKLSRRLALLRNAALMSLLAGCEVGRALGLHPVASVTVSPATASVSVGQTVQLTATLKDASGNVLSGRTVTWASGAPTVATVSPSGLVSGVAVGSATITAASEGQSGSAPATVTAVPGGPGACCRPSSTVGARGPLHLYRLPTRAGRRAPSP